MTLAEAGPVDIASEIEQAFNNPQSMSKTYKRSPLGDDATIGNGDIANGVQVLDVLSQISQAFNNPQSMSKSVKRSPLGDDATLANGDIANGVQVCE